MRRTFVCLVPFSCRVRFYACARAMGMGVYRLKTNWGDVVTPAMYLVCRAEKSTNPEQTATAAER